MDKKTQEQRKGQTRFFPFACLFSRGIANSNNSFMVAYIKDRILKISDRLMESCPCGGYFDMAQAMIYVFISSGQKWT